MAVDVQNLIDAFAKAQASLEKYNLSYSGIQRAVQTAKDAKDAADNEIEGVKKLLNDTGGAFLPEVSLD